VLLKHPACCPLPAALQLRPGVEAAWPSGWQALRTTADPLPAAPSVAAAAEAEGHHDHPHGLLQFYFILLLMICFFCPLALHRLTATSSCC